VKAIAPPAGRRLGEDRRTACLDRTSQDGAQSARRGGAIFDYPGPPAPTDAQMVEGDLHAALPDAQLDRPFCAVAQWESDSVTVWTHSQGVGPLRKALAELLRVSPEKVRCIHVEGSGLLRPQRCRRLSQPMRPWPRAPCPARPVRLQWMREQEHGWEPLGSAMTVELQASLGGDGRIAGWRHEVWSNAHNGRPSSAGGLLAGAEMEPPFPPQKSRPIPMPEGGGHRNANPLICPCECKRQSYHFVEQRPVRVSALRSLGRAHERLAIESFLDELALAAKADPVAFRLAHMQDERARECIQKAADAFGWKDRKNGSGFAFARYKNLGAYCALAMEVAVDRETGAIDVPSRRGRRRQRRSRQPRRHPQPDRRRDLVQSLSWTSTEAVTFDPTHRTSFDWSAYPIARFPSVPRSIDVHVIDFVRASRSSAPAEAGQGPAAAALANAIADATGLRLRDMPLRPDKIKTGLGS